MMKKIRMNCAAALDETFADFLLPRKAKGMADALLCYFLTRPARISLIAV